MSKEYWKPGNMLYPVPAVMVSCARRRNSQYYHRSLGRHGLF